MMNEILNFTNAIKPMEILRNNKYQIWMKTVKIPITGVVFSVDWHLNSGLCSEPGGADVDDGLLSPGPSAGPHHLSVRAGGAVSGGTGGTAGDHEGCTSRPLINSGAKVTDPGAKRSDPGEKKWPRDKTYGPRGKKYRPRDRKYWPRDKKYWIRDSAMSYLWPLIQRQKVLTHIFDHWYTQWQKVLTHTCYNYSDRKYCPISVLTH